MQRDNLSGAESKELIAKAMKKISDWKMISFSLNRRIQLCETVEDVQLAHLYQLYERNLRAYNAVDFDDLIVMPTRFFRKMLRCEKNGKTVSVIYWSMNIKIPTPHNIPGQTSGWSDGAVHRRW